MKKSPYDLRRKIVRLTARGRRQVRRCHAVASATVAGALTGLSNQDVETVVGGLETYAHGLCLARLRDQFRIRRIRSEDDVAMATIIGRVSTEHATAGAGGPMSDEETYNLSRSYERPGRSYFVAVNGRRVVGGAGIAPLARGGAKTCELRKMYLLPECRGKGVGRALLERCIAAAGKYGYRRCYLETTERMRRAIRLYEGAGFKRVPRRLGNTGHFQCEAQYALDLT